MIRAGAHAPNVLVYGLSFYFSIKRTDLGAITSRCSYHKDMGFRVVMNDRRYRWSEE